MAMRLHIEFPQPLNKAQRTSLLLALAALPKAARVRFIDGGHGAVVMGEALGVDRVRSALLAEGVVAGIIHTSLSQEDDSKAEDMPEDTTDGEERLRPIGR